MISHHYRMYPNLIQYISDISLSVCMFVRYTVHTVYCTYQLQLLINHQLPVTVPVTSKYQATGVSRYSIIRTYPGMIRCVAIQYAAVFSYTPKLLVCRRGTGASTTSKSSSLDPYALALKSSSPETPPIDRLLRSFRLLLSGVFSADLQPAERPRATGVERWRMMGRFALDGRVCFLVGDLLPALRLPVN